MPAGTVDMTVPEEEELALLRFVPAPVLEDSLCPCEVAEEGEAVLYGCVAARGDSRRCGRMVCGVEVMAVAPRNVLWTALDVRVRLRRTRHLWQIILYELERCVPEQLDR